MTTYRPDKWVIVEVSSEHGTFRKVFASWYGGFSGSDSWKMSSAIKSIEEKTNHYEFFNESGSIYICNKEAYGMSFYTSSIFEGFKSHTNKDISIKILNDFMANG